jgi:hypothetical protein
MATGERISAQSAPAQEDAAEVIVIGCLVRLDNTALRPGPGTTSAARRDSQNPPSSGFALKDAAIVPRPTSATGSVATRSEREFRLVKTELDLQKFAGQQVEVKARVVGDSLHAADTASAKTGPDERGQPAEQRPGSDTRAPNETANTLRLTAVRVLSRTCPAPGGR